LFSLRLKFIVSVFIDEIRIKNSSLKIHQDKHILKKKYKISKGISAGISYNVRIKMRLFSFDSFNLDKNL